MTIMSSVQREECLDVHRLWTDPRTELWTSRPGLMLARSGTKHSFSPTAAAGFFTKSRCLCTCMRSCCTTKAVLAAAIATGSAVVPLPPALPLLSPAPSPLDAVCPATGPATQRMLSTEFGNLACGAIQAGEPRHVSPVEYVTLTPSRYALLACWNYSVILPALETSNI